MRNLKKLLAVVVAICVLATFTVPAFAADTATTTAAVKTDADVCKELGVIKGIGTAGVTADYLATAPDRVQAAIMFLRLKGLEDTAKAFTGTDNFSDVEGLNDTNKAILAYLKANPDLGFGGVGDNKFDIVTKMTAKAYYKVLLVALGYTYKADGTGDFTWDNVFSFAASKGLTGLIDNTTFTVNDLCKGTVEALKTKVKGGTDTLISKLVDGGSITAAAATASGLYSATAKALEVVSATTDNLITAKIVFNKELDSDTITAGNFANSDVTKDPTLLDDKKTVIVKFQTAKSQSGTADLVIENVKATDGTKIAKVTKTITFVDTTIPVISGVVAKNAKTLVISASEPMNFVKDVAQYLGDVKIDGASAIASTKIDYAKNTITVNLVSLMATGTRKIDISGLKDYANYTAVATSFNVDVAADTTAPAVTAAKLNNLKEVEVTFSEDIDNLSQGTFWVNGTEIPAASAEQQSNPAVFNLTLVSELDMGSIIQVNVEYKGQKDVAGNEVKDKTSFVFKVTDDTTLPTVTGAVATDNKITLTFSKTMYDVSGSAGTIKVYKASDNTLKASFTVGGTATFKANTNKTVIELTASATALDNIDGYDIKVVVAGMKDGTVRKNGLADATLTLKANDTNEPTVGAAYTRSNNGTASDESDDYATFFFSEAMDSTTLNNLSNYVLNSSGSAISLASLNGTSVKSIASDNKSVKVVVPGIMTGAGKTFSVYALKDLAGNMSVSQPTVSLLGTDTLSVVGTTVNAVATNKIEIEFDAKVSSFDPSVFTVRTTSGAISDEAWASSFSGLNTTKIAITLNKSIGTNPVGKVLYLNDGSKVSNVYGTTLAAVGTTWNIGDKVSPTASASSPTTAGSILVTFDENMAGVANYADLANALIVTKASDNSVVALSAANVIYRDSSDAIVAAGTTFRKVEITGLTSGIDYNVEVLPRTLTDVGTNTVAAYAKAAKTVN